MRMYCLIPCGVCSLQLGIKMVAKFCSENKKGFSFFGGFQPTFVEINRPRAFA